MCLDVYIWMLTRVEQIVTAAHRDFVILYAQTYILIAHQKLGQWAYVFTGQNRSPQKVGVSIACCNHAAERHSPRTAC